MPFHTRVYTFLGGIVGVAVSTGAGWFWALRVAFPPGRPTARSTDPFGRDAPILVVLASIVLISFATGLSLFRQRHVVLAVLIIVTAVAGALFLCGWWTIGLSGVFI